MSPDGDFLAEIGPYQFGSFTLSPATRVLQRDGAPVELGGRALDVLIYLLHRAGDIVTKDELMRAVWGGQTVEPNNLTVQLSTLRRVLGNHLSGAPFIVTAPRRGYMFAAPVSRPMPHPGARPRMALVAPPMQSATSFVGRARELAELRLQIGSHRLVTITGMGGVGKTRLMLQLAKDLALEGSERLFRVDLAPVTDPAGVASSIANSVGAGQQTVTPEAAVLYALSRSRAVLVIDNAEHLVREVGRLLHTVLAQCLGISMVVTSRVSLGIAGESVFRLEPMKLPPREAGVCPEQALSYDAVRLFADRAAMVVPGFRLDRANGAAIVEICRRLDGIALAIEMAVPRLLVLTPEQFLRRLDQRFNLLAPPAGDALPRQRSLRAMMEWSWELLEPTEQSLLLTVAVFVGTASLAAVVRMRDAAEYPEWAVLDGLTGLVRASLVIADSGGPEPRYCLLETTRAFALERMTPAVAHALRRQHLAVIAAEFEQAEAAWPTTSSPAWLERYGPDADNVRAALHWAFGAGGEVELGLRLVSVSYPLWWELPSLPLRESRHWFDLAVARITAATPAAVQARLWLGHSWRDVEIGDAANYPAATAAVALFRELGNPVGLGAALWRAGCSVLVHETLAEAMAHLREAEQVLRRGPATKWLALTLVRYGDILEKWDERAPALALFNKALAMARSTDYWFGLMLSGNCLAELLYKSGSPDEALAWLIRLRAELPRGLRNPLVSNLAAHLAAAGRDEEALEAIREVIDETPTTGLLVALARAIEALAMLLAEAGEIAPAARMLGFVLTVHPSSRRRSGGRLTIYSRLNAALETGASAAQLAELFAQGAGWSEADALREAKLLSSPPECPASAL